MAEEYADTWYSRHVALDSGRTSTWTTGLGTARLIEAMATASTDSITRGDGKATPRSSRRARRGRRPGLGKEAMGKSQS